MAEAEDRLMTVQEVASRAAVSAKTVYRAIGAGQLAATRIGRCLRVTGAAFDEWIGLGRTAASAPSNGVTHATTVAGSLSRLRNLEREAA